LAISFQPSAFRHRIAVERIEYVIEQCPQPGYSADAGLHPGKVTFLWADQQGVPLEVIAVETPAGDLIVFHAMRMRRRYWPTYQAMLGSSWGQ